MQIEEKRILGMDSIQDIRHINARRLASRIPSNSISPNSGKTEDLHKGKKGYREAKSGVISFNSPQSISWQWHIPFKKKQENDTGFYSDYSRPMTRPPNHN
ncbi:uncharacterized protein Fot_00721 [Forsythia ovata]|uniref:Uncharacterized protein n=1 Tax=Forsythia ovata TaxID=205694 RepID=A0ABD1X1Y5_9LAMI